jgi:ribosome-associated heat shock protein Hsp15
VNGHRVESAAKAVAVGDVLTIAVARTTALVRVEGLGERRGPAPEARLLYTEVARDDGSLVLEPDRS